MGRSCAVVMNIEQVHMWSRHQAGFQSAQEAKDTIHQFTRLQASNAERDVQEV